MFEFNNKDTRTRPNFASLLNVSIVDFEQVNVNWAVSFRIVKYFNTCLFTWRIITIVSGGKNLLKIKSDY